MKRIQYIGFVVALFFFAFALFIYIKKRPNESLVNGKPVTTIKILDTIVNTGIHKVNTPVVASFVFYNTGKRDLYIQKVEPDCHCTVAKFSHSPISPGDSTIVVLRYDGKNPGIFQSTATVSYNADPTVSLIVFRGEMVQ